MYRGLGVPPKRDQTTKNARPAREVIRDVLIEWDVLPTDGSTTPGELKGKNGNQQTSVSAEKCRSAGEKVRDVIKPLYLLINGTSWPGDPKKFDIIKSSVSAITATLAYCAIEEDERNEISRAKLIPCQLYQELIESESVDIIDILRGSDFPNATVVRTTRCVAVIIPVGDFFLISVRGTKYFYDWLVNLQITKTFGAGQYFHVGFLRAAQELCYAITNRCTELYADKIKNNGCAIYLSGHSLGGAVAAILNQMKLPTAVNACYVFASPRISNLSILRGTYCPFATRRYLDIVPHCPPRGLNYADLPIQQAPDGSSFSVTKGPELYEFTRWIISLAFNQFINNHCIEHYKREVFDAVKQCDQVRPYWNFS